MFALVVYSLSLLIEFKPAHGLNNIRRQEYWAGLPLPSPGDLPKSGIKSRSPALQADSLPIQPPGKPLQPFAIIFIYCLFL